MAAPVVTNGSQSVNDFVTNPNNPNPSSGVVAGGIMVKTEIGCMTTSTTNMIGNCVTTTSILNSNGISDCSDDIHDHISGSCAAQTSPSPPSSSGGYEVKVSSFNLNGSASSHLTLVNGMSTSVSLDDQEQSFLEAGTSPMVKPKF